MTTKPIRISRRHFLSLTSTAAAAASLCPSLLFAQTEAPSQARAQSQAQSQAEGKAQTSAPADPVAEARAAAGNAKITTQRLRGNVSVLMGSGGNIAVLPGPEGKVIVDSGFSSSRPQITEALAALSADPIQHLIDTHWHFDHTDGNEWMHAAGATIVAHERTLQRLSTPQEIAALGLHFAPAPAGALPTKTFATTHSLKLNGTIILLTHYDPAHTDTDIAVHFTDADVLHCGDTFFNAAYPFIDYSSGGNIDGMIRATARNLATGTASTTFIPGHGPIGTRAQLVDYHDMLTAVRASVAALKQQGKSVDEVIAARPTASFDAKLDNGLVKPDVFTRLVYQGV